MADSISNVLVKKFTDLVLLAAQQEGSVCRPWAKVVDSVVGEAVSFDRLGTVAMVPKPSRNAPTPNNDPNHSRVWALMQPYHANIFLDKTDLAAKLSDPTSDYVKLLGMAAGRQWDKFILDASIGTAITGRIGETGATASGAVGTETWPFTDRKSVSHRITESGTTGLTVTKVRQAKRIFGSLGIKTDLVAFVDEYGIEDLLEDPLVTSSEYNTVKALVNGEVKSWMGFTWETVDSDLMTVASSIVSGIFMQRGAVGLGIGIDQNVSVDQRPDLSNAKQAYEELMGGAVRRSGERVVEVQYYAA